MQSTHQIFLVEPRYFSFNPHTAGSNKFQQNSHLDSEQVRQSAMDAFDRMVESLEQNGVELTVFEDTPTPHTPDAVFPNNWISTHRDGTVILYPVFAENRQHERRADIIESLKKNFKVSQVVDLTPHEKEGRFLESTGSIVFDHTHQKAYACLSNRTDKGLFESLCEQLGYEPISFISVDVSGIPIYHSNVMMNIGLKHAVICLESLKNEDERQRVEASLKSDGLELLDISLKQVGQFAGNMLSVMTQSGDPLLILSKNAFESLEVEQHQILSRHAKLLPIDVDVIERHGGGSVRCMMAENFLEKR